MLKVINTNTNKMNVDKVNKRDNITTLNNQQIFACSKSTIETLQKGVK